MGWSSVELVIAVVSVWSLMDDATELWFGVFSDEMIIVLGL